MTDPNRTLDVARDVLARAKEQNSKSNVRLLKRFEQKIRLTENALAAATLPKGAATGAGLRAVLERAEARAGKSATGEQTRAIEALRARIAEVEAATSSGGDKIAQLAESLAADIDLVRKQTAPKAKPKATKKPKKREPTPKKRR